MYFLGKINDPLNAEFEIGQFCTYVYSCNMMIKIISGSYVPLALGQRVIRSEVSAKTKSDCHCTTNTVVYSIESIQLSARYHTICLNIPKHQNF